ncbi:unnamed protein product [Fraxinus pennsylvanica]|uniref:U-box domain-containing protein n=1 Tax=Fraxinus pennsylvanica TaxID=56036 RepID=A0AAD2E651_9LAMI|nr:unnamed protein product [Fraxinus pennsylvanica]
MQLKCLQRLKSIAFENETNKICMEKAGTAEFLASLIIVKKIMVESSIEESEDLSELARIRDEALSILRGSYESRAYAVMLLKSMFEVADDPTELTILKPEFFIELVQIWKDKISQKASNSSLKILTIVVHGEETRSKRWKQEQFLR